MAVDVTVPAESFQVLPSCHKKAAAVLTNLSLGITLGISILCVDLTEERLIIWDYVRAVPCSLDLDLDESRFLIDKAVPFPFLSPTSDGSHSHLDESLETFLPKVPV